MGLYVEPSSSHIERQFRLAVSCQHAMFVYILWHDTDFVEACENLAKCLMVVVFSSAGV